MAPTISPHRSDIRQSTLLSKVTHTASETAAYEFTTLTVSLLE
jgi:ribosome-interacting GTPase 1